MSLVPPAWVCRVFQFRAPNAPRYSTTTGYGRQQIGSFLLKKGSYVTSSYRLYTHADSSVFLERILIIDVINVSRSLYTSLAFSRRKNSSSFSSGTSEGAWYGYPVDPARFIVYITRKFLLLKSTT